MSKYGMILEENINADYVVIMTYASNNIKTGNMLQTWILCISEDPVKAGQSGKDSIVCGDCIHRAGSCYVNKGQAPLSVWKTYKKGKYEPLDFERLEYKTFNRKIRFGAYGDPVLLDLSIYEFLINECQIKGWTGYTHQWKDLKLDGYKSYLMASVDDPLEYGLSVAMGWRSFRVGSDSSTLKGEIVCPNVKEKRLLCIDCGLCDGLGRHKNAKNIVVPAHGSSGVMNAFNRIQIATI